VVVILWEFDSPRPHSEGPVFPGLLCFRGDPVAWAGASRSFHRDRGSDLVRREGALELRLPRLLGAAGGAWLGAEAAQGWLSSRGLYLQLLARLDRRFQLLARANASTYQTTTAQGSQDGRDVGGALHLDAAFASWFRLGARALLRLPVLGSEPGVAGGMLGLDAAGTSEAHFFGASRR
jgi:hypothetical protein